ncbi:universal stress protein [Methanosarcina sp. Mfa9]|uniref:universal stress protein n=1 Tax=Methanosarcina sp. Mfa9 TaxID=3439063 RepID=UPI003F8511CC
MHWKEKANCAGVKLIESGIPDIGLTANLKGEFGMETGTYNRVMIATDGSELGRKAVHNGIEIARLSGAKVYAVYVVTSGGRSAMPKDAGWEKAMKEHLRTEGEDATSFIEEKGKSAGVKVESVILEGNPGDELVKFADKNDIDLVVMGTQGKSGVQRFLLGSVAENVVRHSKNAVLVVRGEKAEES